MTISPASGPAGTVINSRVVGGMKLAPAQYALHLTKGLSTAGADCMSFTGVVTLKTITPVQATSPNTGGAWNVNVTIPRKTTRGTHGICAVETTPAKGTTGTTHETFAVT